MDALEDLGYQDIDKMRETIKWWSGQEDHTKETKITLYLQVLVDFFGGWGFGKDD
jgi:hypothetical protein